MSENGLAGFNIKMFGDLEVYVEGAPLRGLHLREGKRVLAFLVMHQDSPVSYRTLAQTFWPAEARQNNEYSSSDYHSTRQAIYHLRRALGEAAVRLTTPGKGYISLDLTGAEVDYLRFRELADQDAPDAWKQAIDLHRAPLLEGWDDAWAVRARGAAQRTVERLAQAVAERDAAGPTKPLVGPAVPIASPSVPEPSLSPAPEIEEGVVPLDSPYYIERPVDMQFTASIARRDGIVLLKGVRQCGKTSLLARGLQRAREAGTRIVLTDMQRLNASDLQTADTLALTLAEMVADQLDLDIDPAEVWNARRGANVNLDRFLRREVLSRVEGPVLWALDEVDRLFAYPYSAELFGLFRSWHNERSLNPTAPWSRLTLALVYATETHLFIADMNQSPFNVGTRLALQDFTPDQVTELSRRYGLTLTPDERRRLYALVNGHPYLSHRAIAEIATGRRSLALLEAGMSADDGVFGGHLRRLLINLLQDADLTAVLQGMLRGEPCRSERAFYRLRSAGLLRGEYMEEADWRCRIYASYFARHLV